MWDRANRLLSMGGVSYVYNGDGNRIQRGALKYILDLQPGLAQVIGDGDGSRYIHSLRGIHAVSDGSAWTYPLTDALGSVRSVADSDGSIVSTHNYTPIGVMDVPFEWGFTGEQRDNTGVQYHRARYYNPNLGVWLSLDPLEFVNRYSYVLGNPVNRTDRSGLCAEKSLCGALVEMGLDEAYRAVGCDSDKACCGYDVTPWFVQELWNHGNYMEQVAASLRQVPSFPFPLNVFPENIVDEIGVVAFGFREYAAAIPHKWMNFAVNGWNSECPSGWQCTRSVTLCGTCIDRSELGNIIFGYAGGKLAINQDILWGVAYHVVGALQGEAERAAAGIGIHLSAYHIGTVEDFCRIARSATNTFADGSRWDWNLVNSGQEPDVSQCTPCSELLPVGYPHTIPTLNNPTAGMSVWADSSVGEGNPDVDRFFVTQIPGIEYLSPELCPDLYSRDIACGISIRGS